MRWYGTVSAALLAAAALDTDSLAERAPEDRRQATHVVVGTVEGVYVRKEGDTLHYIVEIAVEKVEKGDGLKPGERFYVGCYLWDRDALKGKKLSEEEQKQLARRGAAYDGVPREGERVKAYAKHGWGKYAGVYPDWYDVLKGK
jgi:hypothetical protein